ncbi:hypothetical protein JTB14_013069 [Gonioctena quinquepunctata]|nr:hypothetical protein JTB14_013069 [Gonioctena quinquepunctata]
MYSISRSWIFLCFIFIETSAQEFRVSPLNASSGLYYEKIGEVLLSNNNWEFVTSVDYAGYLLFYQYLQIQAEKLHEFCMEYKSNHCEERFSLVNTALNRIAETDDNMANFLGIKAGRRVKRFWAAIGIFFMGVGNFLLEGAKLIFGGGGGQVDLSAYDRDIADLQSGQRDLENKLNEQYTVFAIDAERKASQIQWLQKTQGEIQNKIGSLESDFQKDSEEKAKQIKELNGMLNETNEKLEKQGEVQKELVTAVEEIKKKMLKVDEDLKDIRADVAENKNSINELELKVKLNSLSIDFNFLMTQFEVEQKKLFDVIKNAKRGNLDPYILTPLNLIQMLQDIQPNLSEGHQFPFYPSIENAGNLYNVIKPDVYLYNNKIIFIMKIPLVNYKKFDLHKMTSIPISISPKKFAFILPQEALFLVDKDYQEFMLMSYDDFSSFCKEIHGNRYLCKQIRRLSNARTSPDCEIKLFATATEVPKSCDVRALDLEQPMFLQLQKRKSWIYVVPERILLIISCDAQRTTEPIEGTGFISLPDNCVARTSAFALESIVEFTKPVFSNYTAHVDLAHSVDLSAIDTPEVIKTHRDISTILPYDLKQLDKISVKLIEKASNLTWLYIFLVLLFISLAGTFGFLILKNKKRINGVSATRLLEFIGQFYPHDQEDNLNRTHDEIGHDAVVPTNSAADDRLKLKVKLNRKDEKISDISIQEEQSSNDPEVEYLTVRFKVKKERDTRISEQINENGNDSDNSKMKGENPEEDAYLRQLRKLKPSF